MMNHNKNNTLRTTPRAWPRGLVSPLLLAAVVLGWAQPVLAQPALFTAAAGADDAAAPSAGWLRWRTVGVDLALLDEGLAGDTFIFNLFHETAYEAVLERRAQRAPRRYTWFGHLIGDAGGTFIVVVEDDVAAGVVRVGGDGTYRVRYDAEGLHRVIQIDADQFPECGVGRLEPLPAGARVDNPQRSALGGGGTVMDVMVVYTTDARNAAGGVNAIGAEIQLAIDDTNDSFDNSALTDPEVRLVFKGEVNYTEPGDPATTLGDLDSGSGVLAEVDDWRELSGADLVCMIVETLTGACGFGNVLNTTPPEAEDAYSVVRLDCAVDNLSFPHELGHNLGCQHAWGDDGDGDGMYAYSQGHRFEGDPAACPGCCDLIGICSDYRTIMAYTPGERIPHFSNPNVAFEGAATGVPAGQTGEADNAMTIDNTATTVAGYRASWSGVSWVDVAHNGTEAGWFDQPFNTVAEGVSDVATGGLLVLVGGSSSETPTISKAMTITAYDGTATIGQ